MLNVVVLISGTGSIFQQILAASARDDAPYRVVAVGADKDAAGLAYARERGVAEFIVRPSEYASRDEWGAALAAEVVAALDSAGSSVDDPSQGEPRLVVSAGFMRVLPPVFVQKFSPRLINTHPALLPLYPGAHAVRDALAAGATETGTTVHIIDEGVDTGPVLRQVSLPIASGETEDDLHERIKEIERELVPETIAAIARGEIDLDAAAAGR